MYSKNLYYYCQLSNEKNQMKAHRRFRPELDLSAQTNATIFRSSSGSLDLWTKAYNQKCQWENVELVNFRILNCEALDTDSLLKGNCLSKVRPGEWSKFCQLVFYSLH